MKNLIENNKLIAGFMGMQNTYIGWYDNEMMMPQIVYDTQQGNHFDDLLFHESWDWLMPVVEKIEEIEDVDENESWHMLVFPIEHCYKNVVEFITWYNENK